MEHSRTEALAQVLMDSIGPRWAGSPNLASAQDWLLQVYTSWGVPARKEQYGTYLGWEQGILHVDLIAPRVQSLEAKLSAQSPGTGGPVEGDVVALPIVAPLNPDVDPSQWLPLLEGKWVLLVPPEALREENKGWMHRKVAEVGGWKVFDPMLDSAGPLGTIESRWSGGWGTFFVWDTGMDRVPSVYLSCEDYGLLYRLAKNNQHPKLRIEAEAKRVGEVPQFNVIAELRGTELPEEYVMLSAHLDSWHSATGASDDGTGTIVTLEAMRILNVTYPKPRRTILVGHWGGEEVGFRGSRTFRDDHPEVVEGLQVLFNVDADTWRIEQIEGQGFLYAGQHFARWLSLLPRQISEHVRLVSPGTQPGGSDHAPFVCVGAPAFDFNRLPTSPVDEYWQYIHHTNRDTYDKIVFDDLKENATLVAMLAYAASEDPERFLRDRAVLPIDPSTGEPREWLACR
jgi:hypothetical protein